MTVDWSQLPLESRDRFFAAMGRLLERIGRLTRERGRDYARAGKVVRVSVQDVGAQAFVIGTDTYRVSLLRSEGRLISACSCPSHLEGPCKHVAALLYHLGVDQTAAPVAPKVAPVERAVPALALAFPSAPVRAVATRIGLYAKKSIPIPRDSWRFLKDHFDPKSSSTASLVLDEAVRVHGADILDTIERLRSFRVPAVPSPTTGYGALYEKLAKRFLGIAHSATLLESLPGPLDDRHPGFTIAYSSATRKLSLYEKPSMVVIGGRSLDLVIPLDDAEIVFGARSTFHSLPDLWDLFALRALLLAMAERTSQALAELEEELARPVWERLLEHVAPLALPEENKTQEDVYFSVTVVGPSHLSVRPYLFGTTKQGKPKWKRMALSELENVTSRSGTEARRLGRWLAGAPGRDGSQSVVDALTPSGHELLRALASYPRLLSSEPRANEVPPPVTIVAGDLTMVLEPSGDGATRPVFRVEGEPIAQSDFARLRDPSTAGFVVRLDEGRFVSAAVPASIRPWIVAYLRVGEGLAFPPEALEKVSERLAPLVAKGTAHLPKSTLGNELAPEVGAALRIEWRPEGSAALELMVSVHPSAPLIEPGRGPELYTFRHGDRRVFVERDFANEIKILEAAREAVPDLVTWDERMGTMGYTEGLEGTLALAKWLDDTTAIARVETKLGARPTAFAWHESNRTIQVSREGAWFSVRGDLRLGDKQLTLGEVLDAARLARKYVPAGDGVYLEIPKDLEDRLHAVATASDLSKESPAGTSLLHSAFSPMLAEVEALFGRSTGVDVGAYAKELAAARKKKRRSKPRIEHGVLRPYQEEGAAWMAELAEWAPGCVLADDMGLGKTVQTAALLLARRKLGPALVVAPASVTSNWVAELERFVPSLSVTFLNAERTKDPKTLGPGDVLVVSYGLVARNEEKFADCDFATMVIDEAQFLKNALAQRSGAVRGIGRRFTVALTGTPLENHLGDLHSLVDQVFPGLLGPEATFRERFRRPIEAGADPRKLRSLSRLVAPFLLRRTRKNVLEELPPREEVTRFVELSPDEAKRYAALRKACELEFTKRKKGETAAQTKIALLAALTRLRQLACDVSLVDPTWHSPSTKLTDLTDIVTELAGAGSRALVFSQFKQLLDRAVGYLERAGLRVAFLAGDTPTTKRREIVERFQRGEYDVFCISLMAGGTGLNLTHASYVIHLDPWWNPAVEEQATSRAHRMGQTEPVTVIRLVSKGTIEEAILELHGKKRDLASAVLEGKATATSLTPEDLLALVRFGD